MRTTTSVLRALLRELQVDPARAAALEREWIPLFESTAEPAKAMEIAGTPRHKRLWAIFEDMGPCRPVAGRRLQAACSASYRRALTEIRRKLGHPIVACWFANQKKPPRAKAFYAWVPEGRTLPPGWMQIERHRRGQDPEADEPAGRATA